MFDALRKTFESQMNAILAQVNEPVHSMAVAVSGGADSLCLTFLAFQFAKRHHLSLTALTVDHGLRLESGAEAAYVHQMLEKEGITHQTLVWEGRKPKTRVEEQAREARYNLLLSYCKAQKIELLLLAHHQNDQAETFFLRLSHASGVDGLSAMSSLTKRGGVYLGRPFLQFSRAQIQAYLKDELKKKWVEDPSNQSDKYERVRFRQAQASLDLLGLTAESVSLSAQRLNRVRVCLESLVQSFIQSYVILSVGGFAYVPWQDFEKLPQELALRVLMVLTEWVRGKKALPKLAAFELCLSKMPADMTIAQCQIVCTKKGFYVCPEYAKMPKRCLVPVDQKISWGRFEVQSDQQVFVQPLGKSLRIKNLPAKVSDTIPAFFDQKGLLCVPFIDYVEKNTYIKVKVKLKEVENGKSI